MYSNSSKDSLYTDRQELKFIAKLKDFDSLLNAIEEHLKPDYPKSNTDYTTISSTYFDTNQWKFLNQHLQDSEFKEKVRLRQYGPNNRFEPEKYLELKYKTKGVKKKCRLKVDAQDLARLQGGKSLPDTNEKLNQDLSYSEYESCKEKLENACKEGVTPVLQVTYKRCSYKGKNIRVTVDRDIKILGFASLKSFKMPLKNLKELEEIGSEYAPSDCIIEIKLPIEDSIPDWLTKIIQEYTNGKDTGFSKYIYGIFHELE